MSAAQWVGTPLLALIPGLALLGVFGERDTALQAVSGPLAPSARSPARLRYRQRMTLDVSVTNRSDAVVPDVRLRIDSAYLNRFSGVSLAPHALPDGSVALGDVAPFQSVRLTALLEGDRAGAIAGALVVTDARGDSARVTLRTTILP